jgi:hypothetical protein
MALVVPNPAAVIALKNFLNHTAPQNCLLKLYSNNVTPGETDTAATYTECSGSGYAAITLAGASWVVTEADPASAAFAQQTFTFTGALGNVYGYFVVEVTSGIIKWAERFAGAPIVIANNGDQIKITPTITAD